MKAGNSRVLKIKAVLLLLFTTCALAGVNKVPSDYPTIQVAIDASVDGDTVLVAPGTYTGDGNRDIDFKGKAITVKSEEGPDSCIIDCNGTEEQPHRGFYFHRDEGKNSIVTGFTIINGYVMKENGAGIFCSSSSPTIRKCTISDNTAKGVFAVWGEWGGFGGGIDCVDSNSIIDECIIVGNTAWFYGGGISCSDGSPKISNCTIINNWASSGGGFSSLRSNAHLFNCSISRNTAGSGGGAFLRDGDPAIHNCKISSNVATFNGGAITSDNLNLMDCRISANSASRGGGGMFFRRAARQKASNCLISGNRAGTYGGAVRCSGSNTTLTNCTLIGNWAGGLGGAICSSGHYEAKPHQTIINCIIRNNLSPIKPEIALDNIHALSVTISHSNLQAGKNSVLPLSDSSSDPVPLIWGTGNVSGYPSFAQLEYWDPNGTPEDPNDDYWVEGDYHLKSQAGRWDPNSEGWVVDDVTSPCIDAGDPNSPVGDEPEPNGGRINMGAYGGTAEASKSGSTWWFATTQGPIAAEELGVILPHEHIFTDLRGPGTRGYGQADAADVVRVMAPLLEEAKQKGVGLLFECSSIGVGRNASILSEVSAAAGLPVVVPTGVYGRANFAPVEHRNMSEDELTELFISEVREGIEGTGIKAGFIKIATGGGNMTALEEKFLRAAGRAARETGAAVASHTNTSNNVTRQADILESISPEIRFVWVHAQSVNNRSLYRQLAERGVFIEFDSLGWNPGQDSTFIAAIKDLLAAGFGEQILLSHDAGWYQPGEQNGGSQMPYTYLIETFIPKLRDNGVDDEAIRMITEENPIRAFGFNQDVNP